MRTHAIVMAEPFWQLVDHGLCIDLNSKLPPNPWLAGFEDAANLPFQAIEKRRRADWPANPLCLAQPRHDLFFLTHHK